MWKIKQVAVVKISWDKYFHWSSGCLVDSLNIRSNTIMMEGQRQGLRSPAFPPPVPKPCGLLWLRPSPTHPSGVTHASADRAPSSSLPAYNLPYTLLEMPDSRYSSIEYYAQEWPTIITINFRTFSPLPEEFLCCSFPLMSSSLNNHKQLLICLLSQWNGLF